jgi:hypothetical protein
VPAAAGLTPGTTYHWYVTPRDREGRWAYAPVEGIFTIAGDAADSQAGDVAVDPAGDSDDPSLVAPAAPVPRDPRRRPRAGGH